MRMKDVNARKEYIRSVRKSFDSPKRQYEFEKESDQKVSPFLKSVFCWLGLFLRRIFSVIRREQSFISFLQRRFQKKLRRIMTMEK